MEGRSARIGHAVRERLKENTPFKLLSSKYSIPQTTIKRHVLKNADSIADVQMYASGEWQDHSDPDLPFSTKVEARGRNPSLTQEEEKLISDTILYFGDNNTPLSRKCVLDLVQDFVRSLPPERQATIPFKDGRPTFTWLYSFLDRNTQVKTQRRECIEEKRINAISPATIAKHFVRAETLCDRYHIEDPRFIFNVDESGVSAKVLLDKSKEKAVARPNATGAAPCETLDVKSNAERCTIMPVISAAGNCFNPVVVVKGKQAAWRCVDGKRQTIHEFCPAGSYVFSRETPGVDGDIFYQWAQNFLKETESLRAGAQKLLLVFDSFAGHVRYRTLNLLKDNGVVVLGLPAHSSHVLQPLDVSVFAPFKAALRSHIHNLRLHTSIRRLDIFTLAEIVTKSYDTAFSRENIISAFAKTGLWNANVRSPSIRGLMEVKFTNGDADGLEHSNGDATYGDRIVNFMQLVGKYRKSRCTLLSDGVVEAEGTVKLDVTNGINYHSSMVLDALKRREDKRAAEVARRQEQQREKEKRKASKELASAEADAERAKRRRIAEDREESALQLLAPSRIARMQILGRSRRNRRRAAVENARVRASKRTEALVLAQLGQSDA